MQNFNFTVVNNNNEFQEWQKAWPRAVITQLQFIPYLMENSEPGAYYHSNQLGIIFYLPDEETYP